MKLELRPSTARLRAPFVSALSTTTERELLLVELTDAAGVTGYGEAAPLGVPLDAVHAALEDCRAVLADGDRLEHRELLAACERVAVLPPALAAIDLALWDLAGRRAGVPVWQLLGAQTAAPVEVNATIAARDRAAAAAAAAAAREAGFGMVKVKVGLGDDAGRVAAVRAAGGSELAIRLDANGVWSVQEALASLAVLAPAGIELCEEPVAGLASLAEVAAGTPIAIALDESALLPGALERRVCRAACLKLVGCGGISGVLDAAARARAAAYEVYLASMLDGPLGIAAALHAAVAISPERACGLATLALFAADDPLPARAGRIAVPSGPGLGDGLLSWYQR